MIGSPLSSQAVLSGTKKCEVVCTVYWPVWAWAGLRGCLGAANTDTGNGQTICGQNQALLDTSINALHNTELDKLLVSKLLYDKYILSLLCTY